MLTQEKALKNRIITYLRKHPKLHKIAKLAYQVLVAIRKPLEVVRYHVALGRNKKYFGSVLVAQQCSPERARVMRNLLARELDAFGKEYKILEVGSWAGQSAILWASVCQEKRRGLVFCVDHWAAADNSPQSMKDATKNNKIFKLFLHNIEASGVKERVFPLKGSSDIIAQILVPDFDFVYIDGDHSYTQFKKDLLHYLPLVKEGGIVCGDDLELQPHEIDTAHATKRREEDCILDPKSKQWFHPGINVAINEVFGAVSMKEGFWAMRKIKNGWEGVDL